MLSVPNGSYRVQDFGDERLLRSGEWEELLFQLGHRLLVSEDYAPKGARFGRGGRDMYLAVVEPSTQGGCHATSLS